MTPSLIWTVLGLLLVMPAASADDRDAAFAASCRIGRGINLGSILEAPHEGAWGLTLQAGYFTAIKAAGFDSVRIPIRWSAHAKMEPPYTVDPAFFERVNWVTKQALQNGLAAIINIHHFREMYRNPDRFEPMLQSLWNQIAVRYKDWPDSLVFELLNEPEQKLTSERWNQVVPGLLAAIRQSNPKRITIVGPGQWNSLHELRNLELPKADHNLIVTFHYYAPFEFTHQGADWVKGARRWVGTSWTGTPDEMRALQSDFDRVAAWSKEQNRPIFLGEFGAYSRADTVSRVGWTRAVVEEATRHSYSMTYWEFGAGFGAYDPAVNAFRMPLLKALDDGPAETILLKASPEGPFAMWVGPGAPVKQP